MSEWCLDLIDMFVIKESKVQRIVVAKVVYIYLCGISLKASHIPHKRALGYTTTRRVQNALQTHKANRSTAGNVLLKEGG